VKGDQFFHFETVKVVGEQNERIIAVHCNR
jgi:hypothetical protein